MQEMWVQSLGQEDPLEKAMATHSSICVWKAPWTRNLTGNTPQGRGVECDWVTEHVAWNLKFLLLGLDSPSQCSPLVWESSIEQGKLSPGSFLSVPTDMDKVRWNTDVKRFVLQRVCRWSRTRAMTGGRDPRTKAALPAPIIKQTEECFTFSSLYEFSQRHLRVWQLLLLDFLL